MERRAHAVHCCSQRMQRTHCDRLVAWRVRCSVSALTRAICAESWQWEHLLFCSRCSPSTQHFTAPVAFH
jgi:hypothetical protein